MSWEWFRSAESNREGEKSGRLTAIIVGPMHVRQAEAVDIDPLAQLWYDGWHDAHAQIVPAGLTKLRTLENFRDRLQAALPDIRVIGPAGGPHAFSIIKNAEI